MSQKKHRNHDRAKGKTHTCISLRQDVLETAKELAAKDNRSLSNWVEVLLMEKIEAIESASRAASDLAGSCM